MDERQGDAARLFGRVGIGLVLALMTGEAARAQNQAAPAAGPSSPPVASKPSSDENLTVLGHTHRFQPAPMPGPELGPPPDKPSPHLGRYKISGDQTKKDGYDTQTGAYIAPFGSAYTTAGPVADGLASRFQH